MWENFLLAHERTRERTHVLCHEEVVHGDNVNLMDALCLELVVLFDVSRRLQATSRCESPGHADLKINNFNNFIHVFAGEELDCA
jgi:hypothetical protein